MRILPIDKTKALQINPNLGIILTADMRGWFYERYVNIFMNGTTIDYIDNVSYAGCYSEQRHYTFGEVAVCGIVNIVEKEIDNDHYMHIWVDEIAIPHSIRYAKIHFVHPLMVYGYDKTRQIVHCVFFDINRGQVCIELEYQDLINATATLNENYSYGGTDKAINETVLACGLQKQIKGVFHIDVFAQQLSNYICCTTDNNMEWYTTSRPGVYDSKDNIYGIQIYLRLIYFLQSREMCKGINYKALHDFILHKKYMLDRFKYIQTNYFVTQDYDNLIKQYEIICQKLEQIRLLNMKKQFKLGCMPATMCYDKCFLTCLISKLRECYNMEMMILPQIYDIITQLTHSKTDRENSNVAYLSVKYRDEKDDYIEYRVSDSGVYVTKIDVERIRKCYDRQEFEYILLNGNIKYYLEKDYINHSPLRTIMNPTLLVKSIRIYTDSLNCDYNVMLHLLTMETKNNDTCAIELRGDWSGCHHLKFLDSSTDKEMRMRITDEDPYIEKEQIYIDADHCPYLHIRMKTTAQTIYAQVYFATIDNPYISMDKSLFYKIELDDNMHSYYINMRHNRRWKGIVQKIRLDPAQYHDNYPWSKSAAGECTIECIEFLSRMPDGEVECMVADHLKDDGSTFLNG